MAEPVTQPVPVGAAPPWACNGSRGGLGIAHRLQLRPLVRRLRAPEPPLLDVVGAVAPKRPLDAA